MFTWGPRSYSDCDPFFANVRLLLHFEGNFADSSPLALSPTVSGDATTSTSGPKFGTASGLFDGSGDRVSFTSSQLALGSGNFTIEFWVKLTALSASQKGIAGNTMLATYWFIGKNSSNRLFFTQNGSGDTTTADSAMVVDTWYHVAFVRSSGVISMFVDGIKQTSTGPFTDSTNYADPQTLYIGSYSTTASDSFDGRLDEFRLTIGVARYSANFTPPSRAFQDC